MARPAELGVVLHNTRRALGILRAAWALRSCVLGERVSVMGPVLLVNAGHVAIGHHAYFLPGTLPTRITVHPGAVLRIGAHSGFNFGVTLEAVTQLEIGERCMFASLVTIRDGVRIEDGVWVAHGATIDPGVTIGEGSVVSAGSHVTRDVPAHHLAIGAPARNVRLATLSRGR